MLGTWEEMRVLAGQILSASPWQCTCLQCSDLLAVPGWEKYHHTKANSLFTWSCSMWLCFCPSSRHGNHQDGCNDGAEEHPRRIFPAVHRRMGKLIRLERYYFQKETMKFVIYDWNELWHQSCYFSDTLYISLA